MTQLYSETERSRDLILGRLAQIESDHGVEIIFAIESGSRAWGFASEDSDYDVRFVYRRKPEDYLRLLRFPDTIGKSVKGALYDVHGWDVGKALTLGLKSNATLLEWIQSPVHYRWNPLAEDLKRYLFRVGDRKGLVYNYFNLARTALEEIEAMPQPSLKKTLYGVRAALCLHHMRLYQGPPPMNLQALLEGVDLRKEQLQALLQAVDKKTSGRESEVFESPILLSLIRSEVELAEATKPEKTQIVSDAALLTQAEQLYRKTIGV